MLVLIKTQVNLPNKKHKSSNYDLNVKYVPYYQQLR